MANYLIQGTIIHSLNFNKLEIIENGYLCVQDNKIISIGTSEPVNLARNTVRIELSKWEFLMPGFIDTHIHAPQYPNAGLGYDHQLLEWLEKYTFPQEAKFKDVVYANRIYREVVQRTLNSGTTTASYFATSHLESTKALAATCKELGQRAFIGLVNMVDGPPELTKSLEETLKETEELVQDLRKEELVQPIITPRFALSCSMDLLLSLGKLVRKYDLHVQTHISENKFEIIETVKKYGGMGYADIYDNAGLLTKKTVLAHAVHLTDKEKELLRKRGSSVSHCPNSNTYLHSGLCDIRDLQTHGINVSLGTDVAGGSNPTILDAMRSALQTANHIDYTKHYDSYLNYKNVFYLATLGGAVALNINVGNFQVGKDFDALIVSLETENVAIDSEVEYNSEELLQKFIYLGDERNIKHVFVNAKCAK